ncbi:AAA family ATPase (plasmid) [Tunturibacter empetritectus]|uniref:AAA family ATPase n=1 Tax=Tunturiibacter empetritectus TaxID=3069691 RepID=A0AAU7ZJR1_9BACT
MNVCISRLQIEHFRGIKSCEISFGQHTVLVGPNNSGKTTIIEALALLFGRDKLIRALTEHDFYGGDPQPISRFRLIATLSGFKGNDPAEHSDWFRNDRGIPKWQDPQTGKVYALRSDPAWQLVCQIAFAARFDRPSLEVDTCRYFHDGDVFADPSLCQLVPSQLLRDIGFFLVPANRTWDRMISFGSELFRRVLTSGDGLPAEAVLLERDRLRRPQSPLEEDTNLTQTVSQLNAELSGFFISAPELRLRVTSTDSDGLLDAVVPHYAHRNSDICLPARRQGSGLVSLQSLFLLLQFGRRRAKEGKGFWMAIEEPELHVPPPLQRRLVQRIQSLSTQTFVSTHSPTIGALSHPSAVVILKNSAGVMTSTPLQDVALTPNSTNAVRKLFQLNRADTIAALMHDVVLIPEGKTDCEWLALLLRAVDTHQGWSSNEDCTFGAYVGLIPTQDGAVVTSYEHLQSLHPALACIVDGDIAGKDYVSTLLKLPVPPKHVLRWCDDWTIENVIGWLIDADSEKALKGLHSVGISASSTSSLVQNLKSKDRTNGGLKQDFLAYENVVDVIASTDACIVRTRVLLNAMTCLLIGQETDLFVFDKPPASDVKVFQP